MRNNRVAWAGAVRLSHLCKELEATVQGESFDQIRRRISQIEEEVQSARGELAAELGGVTP